MNRVRRIAAALSVLAALAVVPSALQASRPALATTVEIVVDGRPVQEYRGLWHPLRRGR